MTRKRGDWVNFNRIVFIIYKLCEQEGTEPQEAQKMEQQQPLAQAIQQLNLGSQQHRAGPQAMQQQHPFGSVAMQPRPSGPPAMQQH
jgi:hypothetical protein